MNCISWNCRGLGRPRAVRALKDLIRSQKPTILGLIETKLLVRDWEQLKIQVGFNCCFAVGRRGKAGGLALLWNSDVDVVLKTYSNFHIDVEVRQETPFRLTLFYGNPRANLRKSSWDLLKRMRNTASEPWLVIGDFNEILYSWEMKGLRDRGKSQMRLFREALLECGLKDLGCKGYQFSFTNKRMGEQETKVRLDRAVANRKWRELFPFTQVSLGIANVSDHRPLLIQLTRAPCKSKVVKEFRFEPMWLRDENFTNVVTEAWTNAQDRSSLSEKLKKCGSHIHAWNRDVFGSVQRKIKDVKERIAKLYESPRTSQSKTEELVLTKELDEWLAREELLWKQRSRADWLKEGEKNTVFFKAKATQRKNKKFITSLKKSDGTTVSDTAEIIMEFTNYFSSLFQDNSTHGDGVDWNNALEAVQPKMTDDLNMKLLEPFTVEEITHVVYRMQPLKAPGPDGFSAIFFQKFWRVVKNEVCAEVLEFLNNGRMDDRLNETVIILLPKSKDAESMEEYRPISLCNVVMKIITKALANRLSLCLPTVISDSQSAFLKGRLISDNILIAHEVTHFIKHRKKGQNGYLSVKVDMSKAYDRVNWSFLKNMLLKLGFDSSWVCKVMRCVESVSYRIKINGSKSEIIKPTRGIRQGDPISPLLFIICQEWLSSSLRRSNDNKSLEGIQVARGLPGINHLFFADDCLFFIKAELRCVYELKKILAMYELLADQQINYKKSEVSGSNNLDDIMLKLCGEYLNMDIVLKHTKYLGLPMVVGQNRTEIFRYIEDRTQRKIQSWKTLLLSAAGKEALIRSGLQAIPLYAMSCFKLPKTLCNKLSSISLNFWWSTKNQNNGIHWIKKDIVQKNKDSGGMDFRCFESLNQAMLMKQLWRIINYQELPISRIYKQKYFRDGNLVEINSKQSDSFAWKCLCDVSRMFFAGLREGDDHMIVKWKYTTDGIYTVKNGYDFALQWRGTSSNLAGESSNIESCSRFWRTLWKLRIPASSKIFAWRLYYDALPVFPKLRRRGVQTRVNCCVCGFEEESITHLFFKCWWSICVWRGLNISWPESVERSAGDWLWHLAMEESSQKLENVVVAAWLIWKNRNQLAHDKEGWPVESCILKCKSLIAQFDKRKLIGVSQVQDTSINYLNKPVIWCDGSWSQSDEVGGFAALATHDDLILGVLASYNINCSSAFESELRGILCGLKLAESLDLDEVTIASDSSEAIWAIYRGSTSSCASVEIIDQCLRFILSKPRWSITHVLRESNYSADYLAKFARKEHWCWMSKMAIPKIAYEARTRRMPGTSGQ